MACLVRETDNLVLDRRAIPRSASGDLSGINCRSMDVLPDDIMGFRGRAGYPAFDLSISQAGRQCAERLWHLIAGIGTQRLPVDGSTIQPRRGACLQAPERQSEPAEGFCQPDRWCFSHSSGRRLTISNMDHASEERAGCQNHRVASHSPASAAHNRSNVAQAIRIEIFGRRGERCRLGVSASKVLIDRR